MPSPFKTFIRNNLRFGAVLSVRADATLTGNNHQEVLKIGIDCRAVYRYRGKHQMSCSKLIQEFCNPNLFPCHL